MTKIYNPDMCLKSLAQYKRDKRKERIITTLSILSIITAIALVFIKL